MCGWCSGWKSTIWILLRSWWDLHFMWFDCFVCVSWSPSLSWCLWICLSNTVVIPDSLYYKPVQTKINSQYFDHLVKHSSAERVLKSENQIIRPVPRQFQMIDETQWTKSIVTMRTRRSEITWTDSVIVRVNRSERVKKTWRSGHKTPKQKKNRKSYNWKVVNQFHPKLNWKWFTKICAWNIQSETTKARRTSHICHLIKFSELSSSITICQRHTHTHTSSRERVGEYVKKKSETAKKQTRNEIKEKGISCRSIEFKCIQWYIAAAAVATNTTTAAATSSTLSHTHISVSLNSCYFSPFGQSPSFCLHFRTKKKEKPHSQHCRQSKCKSNCKFLNTFRSDEQVHTVYASESVTHGFLFFVCTLLLLLLLFSKNAIFVVCLSHWRSWNLFRERRINHSCFAWMHSFETGHSVSHITHSWPHTHTHTSMSLCTS